MRGRHTGGYLADQKKAEEHRDWRAEEERNTNGAYWGAIVSGVKDYQARQEARERRQQQKQAAQRFGGKSFRHPDKMVRFTWWVAVFTGCLFCTALIQAWAFIQSERAALSLIEPVIERGLVSPAPFVFFYKLRNSGRSMAIVTNIAIYIGSDEKSHAPPQAEKYAATTIGPGESSLNIFEPKLPGNAPYIFTEAQIAAIKSGTIPLKAWGTFRYEDEFTVLGPKEVEFCYVYEAPSAAQARPQ